MFWAQSTIRYYIDQERKKKALSSTAVQRLYLLGPQWHSSLFYTDVTLQQVEPTTDLSAILWWKGIAHNSGHMVEALRLKLMMKMNPFEESVSAIELRIWSEHSSARVDATGSWKCLSAM